MFVIASIIIPQNYRAIDAPERFLIAKVSIK